MIRLPLERSTHPSQEQIEALLGYLEQHPQLARGFPKLPAARNKIKKRWEQLAPLLNRRGKSVKTWQQWIKYWSDKRSAVKKKAAMRAAALKAGSNPDLVMELSEVEERILSLIVQDYVIDTQTAIPLTCDNSGDDVEVCNASVAETHLMDKTEVVLLMTPTAIMQEASPQAPSLPPATPPLSPSPSPSPSRQPTSYRVCSDSTSPKYQNAGVNIKYRRRSYPLKPPPTVKSQFAAFTERFLRIEEQRLELDRRNTSILETVAGIAGQLMERDFERERVFAQALGTVGEGLRLLAEALKNNDSNT